MNNFVLALGIVGCAISAVGYLVLILAATFGRNDDGSEG